MEQHESPGGPKQRELTYRDILTLSALMLEISTNGEKNQIDIQGYKFKCIPIARKFRFKGDGWWVDCPAEHKYGTPTNAYVQGDQAAFERDMMLCKLTLNCAAGGEFS